MSETTFNWGIIAPGRIAHNFAKALKIVPNASLYAVASSNLERAQAFALEYDCENAYDEYQTLIDDPQVDAIYIANPHRFHFECARKCLIAGKAVLCEKPITVNEAQIQELISLAEKHQTFLMEAVWTRFLPVWQQVMTWLSEQRIGDIRFMSSSFSFNVPRDESDRLLNNELAGGALLDTGIYNLTMSQFVMKCEPSSIVANGMIGETNVDERTSVILDYDGVASQFTCGLNVTLDNNFKLYGSKGSITIDPMFWAATKAVLSVNGEDDQVIELPFRATGFEYQIEEVMNCIAQGKLQSDVISWQDSINTMKNMDEIRRQIGLEYAFLNRD
ncbi:Gfo/Idh/MocA family oxidoreductase [Vibrio sp. Y2-5]|uniref:Gfo/Idh/MocA family protein n=1 Tax=Vibrio sp. Y2-5 TaxID=2743977 RepID=UPI0016607361|nr:Gfo/Idh/MocA family oxidoreductase [Vibrio sp. Y2-5]MBD0785359.1 Gfo/Idh/MocA family oxidoreductase [Vibrio sp. Y2-5]